MKYVAVTTALTIVLRCAPIGAIAAPVWAEVEPGATPPAEQTDAAGSPADADKSKLICTREPVMGSNIKKKTCKTQAQIDEQRDASRDSLNELNRGQGRNNGSGG